MENNKGESAASNLAFPQRDALLHEGSLQILLRHRSTIVITMTLSVLAVLLNVLKTRTCFVATNVHDSRGRWLRMRATSGNIGVLLGQAMPRMVCVENPLRFLEAKDVEFARDMDARRWTDSGPLGTSGFPGRASLVAIVLLGDA